MKYLRLLFASLIAIGLLGSTVLLPGAPVAAHPAAEHETTGDAHPQDADTALTHANTAITGFLDAYNSAIDLEGANYNKAVIAAADTAAADIQDSIASLQARNTTGTLADLKQQLIRMQRQLDLASSNAAERNIGGTENAINGFYDTMYEYDNSLVVYSDETGYTDPNYQYEYNDTTLTPLGLDRLSYAYLGVIWVLLALSAGTAVWVAQKPRYRDTQKLKLLRLIIACTAWSGLIGIGAGFATYQLTWEDTSIFDGILAFFTGAVLIGLTIYYFRTKKHALASTSQPAKHTTTPKAHA